MGFQKGNQINKGQPRGGKREGAGRKSDVVKAIARTRGEGYIRKIERLARLTDSDKVKLSALIYLTDRELGKPVSKVEATVEARVLLVDDLGGG